MKTKTTVKKILSMDELELESMKLEQKTNQELLKQKVKLCLNADESWDFETAGGNKIRYHEQFYLGNIGYEVNTNTPLFHITEKHQEAFKKAGLRLGNFGILFSCLYFTVWLE